jgi:ADP-ribose pyrophosphatase YjhB (NUDIX family)
VVSRLFDLTGEGWPGKARTYAPVSERTRPPGWLPKAEFDSIYSRVPRLCVEVVIVSPERGVLLSLRDIPPNIGAWHIPGGTVLFGEPLVEAVRRVARDELESDVAVGELLGYIEYPSHYENGLDCPVGLAFRANLPGDASPADALPDGCEWFTRLPHGLYEEQRDFLVRRLGFESA